MSPTLNALELALIEQRKADETIFLEAWRNWRQGRSREEAEAKAAWLLENGAPIFAGVAQRELDLEREGERDGEG